jgi:hypothetical protein
MPEFHQVLYEYGGPPYTATLAKLLEVYSAMDVYKDPYVVGLLESTDEKAKKRLDDAIGRRKTWCFQQMKSVVQTSTVRTYCWSFTEASPGIAMCHSLSKVLKRIVICSIFVVLILIHLGYL